MYVLVKFFSIDPKRWKEKLYKLQVDGLMGSFISWIFFFFIIIECQLRKKRKNKIKNKKKVKGFQALLTWLFFSFSSSILGFSVFYTFTLLEWPHFLYFTYFCFFFPSFIFTFTFSSTAIDLTPKIDCISNEKFHFQLKK